MKIAVFCLIMLTSILTSAQENKYVTENGHRFLLPKNFIQVKNNTDLNKYTKKYQSTFDETFSFLVTTENSTIESFNTSYFDNIKKFKPTTKKFLDSTYYFSVIQNDNLIAVKSFYSKGLVHLLIATYKNNQSTNSINKTDILDLLKYFTPY